MGSSVEAGLSGSDRGDDAAATGWEMLVTIGAASEQLGLTRRAIRHYEARGLVRPARGTANHRLYSLGDRSRLQLVALLRRAGLSIGEIGDLLTREGAEALQSRAMLLLQLRRDRLMRELDAVADASRQLQAWRL